MAEARTRGRDTAGRGSSDTLVGLLDHIEETTSGDEVAIAELVEALARRGIGSLLVLASLLAILPTGAIPGMSVLTGLLMLLLSAELLFGMKKAWLPDIVTRQTIPRDTLARSIHRARGPAERVGRLLKPRFEALLEPPFLQLLAAFGVVVSLSLFPLALVPFGAFPAGLAFLVIGTGLMVRDGLVVAAGIALGVLGLVAAWYLWPY